MSNKKPNILLIMSDQHSRRFSSPDGHPVVKTPNLDYLAANGVRFENAYCNSPLCVPSRMSFMTGKNIQDIEVWDNNAILSSEATTWAEILNKRGYEAVLSGRMHFRGEDQLHGFAEQIAMDESKNASIPNWESYKRKRKAEKIKDVPKRAGEGKGGKQKMDDEIEAAAIDYIQRKQADARPWALTVGFHAPHGPWIAEKEYIEKYSLEEIDMPQVRPEDIEDPAYDLKKSKEWIGLPEAGFPPKVIKKTRRAYYALISRLDDKIGNLMEALEKTGQLQDTIIIYTSDHGEMLGERGRWKKSSLYEPSLGVPMIFYWKDQLPTGKDPQKMDLTDGEDFINWLQWRCDHSTTKLMKTLRDEVNKLEARTNRNIPISVRVPAEGFLFNMAMGMDVKTWIKEGLIDELQLDPLENRCPGSENGSHNLKPYLELCRKHGIIVFGGVNGTTGTTGNPVVGIRMAMGVIDSGVDGLEVYESERFAHMKHERWLIPLWGNKKLAAKFLEESNIEAVYPIKATDALGGHDNHWSAGHSLYGVNKKERGTGRLL